MIKPGSVVPCRPQKAWADSSAFRSKRQPPAVCCAIATALTFLSCAKPRVLPVPVTSLSALAKVAADDRIVVTPPDDDSIVVTDSMAPVVALTNRASCAKHHGSKCEPTVVSPLARLAVVEGELFLPAPVRSPCLRARSAAISENDIFVVSTDRSRFVLESRQVATVLGYAEGTIVRLGDGAERITLEASDRPVLVWTPAGGCKGEDWCARGRLIKRLDEVRLRGAALRFCHDQPDVVASPRELSSASLILTDAPAPRSHASIGVDLGGPAMLLGIGLRWHEQGHLVLECGAVGTGPGIGGWLGSRARMPIRDWGAVSFGASAGALTNEGAVYYLAGPRLGLEYIVSPKRGAFRLEAQLANSNLFHRAWHPWGGLGYESWF